MATKYKQLAFHVNQADCTGCKACQVACKDKHDLKVGVTWRRVAEYSGGSWQVSGDTFEPNIFSYYTSVACNHCQDPICVKVCPSKAMHKGENGIVSVDASKCIGCRFCEMSCPYGAPEFDAEKHVMTKCNFCADYIAEGRAPACVASCPSRVLDYGEYDDMKRKYGEGTPNLEPLPDANITKPYLLITPHPKAQASGSGNGKLANPKEI